MEIVISANEYADYWRCVVGANVIPAKSKEKTTYVKWSLYQDKPIPQKLHDQWKEQNKFESGMAVICGKIFHNKEHEGKWLNGIDCDNKLGLDEITYNNINQVAKHTVVEQHANKEKCHIYYYTTEPIKSKATNARKDIPQIEVKSGGKHILYCAGSYHKDGSLIEILGTKQIRTVDKETLENNIESICKPYDIPYLSSGSTIKTTSKSDLPIKEMMKEDVKLAEGENRSLGMIRYLLKKKLENPEFTEEILHGLALNFNQVKCSSAYDSKKVKDNAKQAFERGTLLLTNKEEAQKELDKIKNSREFDTEKTAYIIIKQMITGLHEISKDTIYNEISAWNKEQRLDLHSSDIKKFIENVWTDKKTFGKIKTIAYHLGVNKEDIQLDKGQIIEVAEWIKGRYHIKRVEIDGEMLFFNDYFYEKRARELVKRTARDCLIDSNQNNMKEIISYIEDTCELITLADIERDVHLKCLLNGVYNIKTGEFVKEFSSEHIILNQIPHNFNEKAKFEDIDEVVSTILSEEKSKQSFYDFISTCLHPYTGIDLQFGGVGQPGTGKSQLCDLIVLALGIDNVSEASIHNIAKDPTTQKDCAFKMCNIDRDLSAEDIKQTGILKKWITQDRLNARAIYEHSGDFVPTARLCFMANDLYEIANHDDAQAIYERTHLVRIDNKFRGTDNQVNKIMQKTATELELDGFVSYLLKNASELYELQKIHHPMKSKDVEALWNLHGNRIKEFFKKWFVKDPQAKTERSEVFDKWLAHALEKEFPSKGRDTFYDQFEEIVGMSAISTRKDNIPGRYYVGLRLLTKKELEMKKEDDT